jgi:hypothetical protein
VIWLLVGVAVGLVANWLYRSVMRALLGDEKWRRRAIAKLDHDDFLKFHASAVEEYARRFGGAT